MSQLPPVDAAEPIFIVGVPRSGTSLLRLILNRHPSIAICDESYYFYYVYSRQAAFGDLSDPKNRLHLIREYLATRRMKRLGIDLGTLEQILMEEGTNYDLFFLSLIRFYAAEHGKQRFGEKTPEHAFYADTLCRLYPQGKLINLVRDPRDVVASLLRMPWAKRSATANARDWVKYTMAAKRVQADKNYLLVKYEDLVLTPETELKRICAFLGEDFYPEMMEPDERDGSQIASHWWFQRAKTPLSRERMNKWQEELTPRQVAQIEWITGEVMTAYGYAPAASRLSVLEKTSGIVEELAASVRSRISQRGHLWYYWFQPTQIAKEEAWVDAKA